MTDQGRSIETMALSRLKLAASEYRPDVNATIESLQISGWAEPPLVDERTGRIIVRQGHVTALREMRRRGLEPPRMVTDDGTEWWVPVTRGWASTDDDDAQAYARKAVELVRAGGWDDDGLAEVLGRRLDDLTGTGFDPEDAALRVLLAGDRDPDEPAGHGSIVQIVFLFEPDDFTAMYEALGLIREQQGIPSNAEAFVWALTDGQPT